MGPTLYFDPLSYHAVVTKDLRKNNEIWVCPNSDYVCTRFFFVYDKLSSHAKTSTSSPEFKQEIDHAMAYIKAIKAVS